MIATDSFGYPQANRGCGCDLRGLLLLLAATAMKRFYNWLVEPVPTARFIFYAFLILLVIVIIDDLTK